MWASLHQKGKLNIHGINEEWDIMDHMQIICISLQTDNQASTSSFNFFKDHVLFLTPNKQY